MHKINLEDDHRPSIQGQRCFESQYAGSGQEGGYEIA